MGSENIAIDFINLDPITEKTVKRVTDLSTGEFEDTDISYYDVPGIQRPPISDSRFLIPVKGDYRDLMFLL